MQFNDSTGAKPALPIELKILLNPKHSFNGHLAWFVYI